MTKIYLALKFDFILTGPDCVQNTFDVRFENSKYPEQEKVYSPSNGTSFSGGACSAFTTVAGPAAGAGVMWLWT